MLITFLPLNRKIHAEVGANLFRLAIDNGIDLGGVCAGYKTCGKCRVLITKGNTHEYQEEEINTLTDEELRLGMRLACCFSLVEDTCVILSGSQKESKQIKQNKSLEFIDKRIKNSSYGIAFDIGTTSVVAELWNLNEKICMGQISDLNPQSLYGADVITRITYASHNKDNLNKLRELIVSCCNNLITKLSESSKIDLMNIVSIVVAANTTMMHLFLGRSVSNLLRVPFQGVSYKGEEYIASDIGLNIHPNGIVYAMPGIGGHVGSDTLGCILASNLADTNKTILMVDIGTNGEIVIAKDGVLTACSTAAGPAFEGAALQQGMRAVDGAIFSVDIRDSNHFHIKVIGNDNTEPMGICGSGVIEAVSECYRCGILDETGRLLDEYGDKNFITLWQQGNKQIVLTQKDIRELQLAKGAIFAGMKLLLKNEEISFSQLDKLYLAGAFGSNINLKKAIHIGLLPNININKIENIGNGSLNGATKLLLGEISHNEAEEISKSVKHLELALCDEFQEAFIDAISFPLNN